MSMRGGGRGGHGGWGSMINAPDERPRVTWDLLKRVLRHAAPVPRQIAGMLAIILVSTGLSLLNPLIMRDLIDRTIPAAISSA
jgi:ATP-binding cassette, subfamily B, bacterial